MSKFLLLLLFVLVQNMESDGITVYDAEKLEKLMGNVAILNVKEGDEFFIRFQVNKSIWRKFINYNEIPDALDDFGKGGQYFRYEIIESPLLGAGAYHYYKFKALKPSINEIALKFEQNNLLQNKYSLFVIKINILSKDQTS